MRSAFSRRMLVQALAALGPATVAGRVWAAPQTQARLLMVFFRGAYDATNVVIPIGSDFYYQSRPTLAVPRPGSNPAKGIAEAVALDGDWGMHPALRAGAGLKSSPAIAGAEFFPWGLTIAKGPKIRSYLTLCR